MVQLHIILRKSEKCPYCFLTSCHKCVRCQGPGEDPWRTPRQTTICQEFTMYSEMCNAHRARTEILKPTEYKITNVALISK